MTKITGTWRGFLLAVVCTLTGVAVSARADNFDPFATADASPALATADNDPTATDEEAVDPDEEPNSLRDLLELDLQGNLRRTARGEYIRVRLENVSEETVKGPVYLVVKSTGIEGLEPAEPVLLLEADDDLRPDRFSRPKTVRFQAPERLTMDERAKLDLDYDLVRQLDGANLAKAANAGNDSKGNAAADADALAKLNAEYGLAADAKTFPGKTYGPRDLVRVTSIKTRSEDRLFGLEGVHGVGVSEEDGQLVVRVFIDRLGNADALPKTIDGIPVRAKVAARVKIIPPTKEVTSRTEADGADSLESTTGRYRPLRMGISINNWDSGRNSAGTLGFFARDSAGNVYGVTNYHVIDNSFGSIGHDIVQPGRLDGGRSTDNVGTLQRVAPITFSTSSSTANKLDAAIFRVGSGQSINPTTISGHSISASLLKAYPNLQVRKHGRTTDLTTGTVSTVSYTTNVGPYGNGQTARFTNQIRITGLNGGNFSSPGDSGSLIFSSSGNRPVGLLFAGSGNTTVANDIDEVLNYFGLTVQNTAYTVGGSGWGTYSIRTWRDDDADGRQDSGEPSLNGVRVWMYDWTAKTWSYTDSSGGYAKFNVLNGRWYRFWVAPPSGYAHSPKDVGSDDADSDFATDHYSGWYQVSGSSSNVDCGLVPPPATRTYTVNTWQDKDGDGYRDSGEPVFNNVQVWIYDWATKKWSYKYTSNGSVSFSVKDRNWYRFWVVAPSGHKYGPTGGGRHNDFSTNYSNWYQVSGSRSDIGAGFVPPITDTYVVRTWRDDDGDGRRDSGEPGLNNVKVWIYDYTAKKWSYKYSSNGQAAFGVTRGQWYKFWVANPSGLYHSPTGSGLDNDVATDHYTGWYQANGSRSDIDAAFAPPQTYTVNVWRDYDKDGYRDSGDGGLNGVRIWIYDYSAKKWSYKDTSNGRVGFTVAPGQWYRFWVAKPSGYNVGPTGGSRTNDFFTNQYSAWYKVTGSRSDIDCGLIR